MFGTSDRQWVWAAGAVVACGAAVGLAAPSGWLLPHGTTTAPAQDAVRGLPTAEALASPSSALAMPSDVAAARFASPPLDAAQRTPEDELAPSRAELDGVQLRPEALIAQEAGSRYAALDVNSRPAAPPAAPPR